MKAKPLCETVVGLMASTSSNVSLDPFVKDMESALTQYFTDILSDGTTVTVRKSRSIPHTNARKFDGKIVVHDSEYNYFAEFYGNGNVRFRIGEDGTSRGVMVDIFKRDDVNDALNTLIDFRSNKKEYVADSWYKKLVERSVEHARAGGLKLYELLKQSKLKLVVVDKRIMVIPEEAKVNYGGPVDGVMCLPGYVPISPSKLFSIGLPIDGVVTEKDAIMLPEPK